MVNMKYSGFKWIGKVPADWNIERLQWHLKEINIKNNPVKTTDVLSLTNKLGVVPYEEKGNQGNKAKENYSDYKIAFKDTIVANSMNILIGSVGYCNYFGCVSPVYYVFKELEGNNLKFINYIMQTNDFQKELKKYANGILEIRLRVSANDILKRFVAIPSLTIQNKIVKFLDKKCEEINFTSKEIQKEIDTLQEYKKSLITEIVTKGLDKTIPFKYSGLEWIGEIPKHWSIKRLKYITNKIYKGNGITKEDVFANGEIPCVRYGEIYSKYNDSFDTCISYTDINRISSPQYFSKGDILFAGTGELIEEIGKNILYTGNEKCLAGGDIIIVRTNQNYSFLNYALNSMYIQAQKSYGKFKLKVVHISQQDIANLLVALPPRNEQKQISDYLDKKCKRINDIIKEKQQQIEILEEYKKSLIYEYVTGKKEVV